jgi:hypothetical protein
VVVDKISEAINVVVNKPVDGTYVKGDTTLSTNKGVDADAPAQKIRLYDVALVSFAVATLFDVVEVVDVVEFPNKSPLNSLQARREVDGLYDKGVTLLSTNSGDDPDTVLANGIKYDPAVSSLVNATADEVEAVFAFPLKVVAMTVEVDGLYCKGVVVLSTYKMDTDETVLLNGIKYVPLVLSLVNDIADADDAFPINDDADNE